MIHNHLCLFHFFIFYELCQFCLLSLKHCCQCRTLRDCPLNVLKYQSKSQCKPITIYLVKEEMNQRLIKTHFSIASWQSLNKSRERNKLVWCELICIPWHDTFLIQVEIGGRAAQWFDYFVGCCSRKLIKWILTIVFHFECS